MLQRISIDDLAVGMYVEAVTKQQGALKIKSRGRVASQRTIDQLKAKGIIELAIDPDNILQPSPIQPASAAKENPLAPKVEKKSSGSGYDPTVRNVSFGQEINKASALYTQAKKLQKRAFADALSGRKINIGAMEAVADGFVDSAFRNQDALICMSRIGEKDAYLLEHSINVSILMTILAKHMKLDKDKIHQLTTGALLHDIGKIKVPDNILHKPGKLSPDELRQMQQHAIYSKEILEQSGESSPVYLQIAAHHHERLDGSGYPQGLSAGQLSTSARMVAIIDSYDAMTAHRCYQDGMHSISAFKILKRDAGTLFDEKLVNLFIQAIGIHPVGTLVKLKSQKLAIVTQSNFADPLKPVVKAFYHVKFKHYTEIKDIDLSQSRERIDCSVKPENFKIDLARFLKSALLN